MASGSPLSAGNILYSRLSSCTVDIPIESYVKYYDGQYLIILTIVKSTGNGLNTEIANLESVIEAVKDVFHV